jgi:excisionase family DNA binding protein
MMDAMMTTEEKAQQLGVTRRRILALIKNGRFKTAQKRGMIWFVHHDDFPDDRHDGPTLGFRMMDKG